MFKALKEIIWYNEGRNGSYQKEPNETSRLGEYNMKNEKLLDGLNNRVDIAKEKVKEPKCGTRESIQTEEKEK